MAYKNENRKRHNTIAFYLSDEERAIVDARILMSGMKKGEYYRKAVLGEEIQVIAGRYMSERVATILKDLKNDLKNTENLDYTVRKINQILEIILSAEKNAE